MAGETYAQRYAGGFKNRPDVSTPADAAFLNAVESALLRLLGEDPAADEVGVWVPGSDRFEFKKITNANVDAAAAIDYSKISVPAGAIAKSKLAALGIVNADVDAAAAIALDKLADGAAGDILAMVAGAWAGSKGLRRIFESIPGANAVTHSVTNIDQNYRHLLVVGSLNTNNPGSSQNISLRFNAGSTADYYTQRLVVNGAAVAASESLGQTSFVQAGYVDQGFQHGVPFIWFIPNYTFAGAKTIYGLWGVFTNISAGSGSINVFTGAWRAGGAITSIDLVGASGVAWGGMPVNVITGFGIG